MTKDADRGKSADPAVAVEFGAERARHGGGRPTRSAALERAAAAA